MANHDAPRILIARGHGPEVSFLLHRLGQLEAAYRETARRVLPHIDPASDEAASVRRVLDALDF